MIFFHNYFIFTIAGFARGFAGKKEKGRETNQLCVYFVDICVLLGKLRIVWEKSPVLSSVVYRKQAAGRAQSGSKSAKEDLRFKVI